ncbi:hypothetical protein N9K72_01145 [Pontimonas sp.]|nr:hypothetical protein [Pontimonas sp.]
MRIIVAIVLLAISTLSLAVGIAERTVFDEPETIERVITTDTKAPATIIPGSVLTSYPGRQTITIQGGVSGLVPDESGEGFLRQESDQAFVAYGSTLDVMAWLAPGRHTKLSYDPVLTELSQLPRSGDTFLPDPRGSDLWFNEFSGEGDVTLSLAGNEDITVLVMTDGVLPAPQTITISWPGATEAPWILAALILGVLTFIAGIIVALSSLVSWRERRGPRRKRTRSIRAPRRRRAGFGRTRRPRPAPTRKRGRRVASRVVFPLVGGLVLGLGACAAPPVVVAEDETETTAAAPNPAVTETQFVTIMARVAGQIQLADQELSVNTLNPRVTEPTLSARRVAYIVTRADAEAQRLMPIPSLPIRLVLPQQTTGWPRSVFAVIQDEQDLETPSLGVVLRQEDPRSNYRLTYAIVLNPQVQLPDLPPATLGAAKLRADSKLIRVTPSALLAHYADVANSGLDSPFAEEFSLATDTLYSQMGPEALQLRQESFGDSVEVSWSTSATDQEIVAFSTSNAGALVLGTLRQVERVAPVQSGAAVNSSIGIRALTSLSQSSVGFDVDSDVQILFYVPPVGSEEGVRVLGYTYSLVAAREVGNE